MKHHWNHNIGQNAAPQLVPVRFEFTDPSATKVSVAGTFNNWHATAKPMHASCDGHWLTEAALAPGTYEYCLVVDGRWIPDPQVKDCVPNPFGGTNSVLKVAATAAAMHRAEAINHPLKNDNN